MVLHALKARGKVFKCMQGRFCTGLVPVKGLRSERPPLAVARHIVGLAIGYDAWDDEIEEHRVFLDVAWTSIEVGMGKEVASAT